MFVLEPEPVLSAVTWALLVVNGLLTLLSLFVVIQTIRNRCRRLKPMVLMMLTVLIANTIIFVVSMVIGKTWGWLGVCVMGLLGALTQAVALALLVLTLLVKRLLKYVKSQKGE